MMIPGGLTVEELAAGEKGYWNAFQGYVDYEWPVWISPDNYAKLVEFCEPYMARGHEVQGAVKFHASDVGFEIERVYVMGGASRSLRVTCELDPADMLRQMQADYPEMAKFMTDQVGWWHLHPGYMPGLSVGDVEECRQTLSAPDAKVLQLLMYGDGRGYQLSAYAIGRDEVARFPVRFLVPTN